MEDTGQQKSSTSSGSRRVRPAAWSEPVNLDDSSMSEDKIHYDILASEALRGIVRTVLQRAQKRGLPGDHHFYITFDTCAPGTILSKRLKDQYPDEMMIVLQHRFWDLMVYDDRFEVKLSFNNIPERLVVPFAAINGFVDPSVRFGFNPNALMPIDREKAGNADSETEFGEIPERVVLPGPSELKQRPPEREKATGTAGPTITQEEQPVKELAEIVELHLFRKK